ncbi:hypothetical protein FRC00_000873, partial [Tulasnella sp. 408]
YNIPGSDGGSTPVGPIIGGIVGAIALIAAGGLAYYFWRKRHPKRRSNSDFWDNDDLGGGKHTNNPGIVATPFEWDGPSKPQGGSGNVGMHYGGVEGEQAPGSPSFAATQPLLGNSSSPPWSASAHTTSFSGPSSSSHNNLTNSSNPNVYQNQLGAPMVGPRTHTSSGSGDRRGSGLTGSTLVASNPDPGRGEKNPGMFAMGPIPGRHDTPGPSGPAGPAQPGRPTSGPIDETQLVDRIAHRLADIMTERVGVAGSDAPPSYVGDDGEYFGAPPQPPSTAAQDSASPSPAAAGNSTYPPQLATSPRPPTSPQYVQSPPSATTPGQLQPPTPPAGTTSFGAGAGAGRFGPRPRPSDAVSARQVKRKELEVKQKYPEFFDKRNGNHGGNKPSDKPDPGCPFKGIGDKNNDHDGDYGHHKRSAELIHAARYDDDVNILKPREVADFLVSRGAYTAVNGTRLIDRSFLEGLEKGEAMLRKRSRWSRALSEAVSDTLVSIGMPVYRQWKERTLTGLDATFHLSETTAFNVRDIPHIERALLDHPDFKETQILGYRITRRFIEAANALN